MTHHKIGIIFPTKNDLHELDNDLAVCEYPVVVISNGGPDYSDVCKKYQACYIHSDICTDNYSIHECLEVILNRLCLGAAALPVSDIIRYYVNNNKFHELKKKHVLDNIATNKHNILIKHKNNINITYDELFLDLEKW